MSLKEAVFSRYTAPIEILELSVRGYNCLKRAGVNIIADLIEYSFEDLLEIKNMDRKSAVLICRNLEEKLNLFLISKQPDNYEFKQSNSFFSKALTTLESRSFVVSGGSKDEKESKEGSRHRAMRLLGKLLPVS
ncbi:hypothetical protein NON20_25075 (plasmid) [Synechocystis sp. B12]|nr:hypothetical protein NON20_25075 [Synechocystis sp. B12]